MPALPSQSCEPCLRRLAATDVAAVLDAFRSGSDMARQGGVTNEASARCYVQRLLSHQDPEQREAVDEVDAFAVVDDADRLWGMVAMNRDAANRVGWFWYWMHVGVRGRGWAGRAAATVANWALTQGQYERLELGYRDNNPASGKVALHAGFVPEGTERQKSLMGGQRVDVHVAGRLVNDPAPQTQELLWTPAKAAPVGSRQ